MEEIWKNPGTLPRRHILGEMSLKKVAESSAFCNHLRTKNLDDDQIQEVAGLIRRMAPNFKNVSALRKSLLTNPKELGFDTNNTRTLLALFIDTRKAVEYK